VRLKPDYALAHFNLGLALFEKSDVDGAIVEYQAALKMNPYHAKSHYYYGKALLAKGRNEEAAREFADAEQIDPRLKAPVNLAQK
jgi:tetratricopeptide (TPR) repeat protein